MLQDMAMELRHLRYFITVADEGHVTRAADRLGIQQPPLSQLIKSIEQELDVQLFRRKPRGVELTDAGRAFLDNARVVLSQLDHTFETTRRTARGEQGRISVGYSSSTAFHPLVPRVMREFREAFPLVSVTLTEDFPDDLIERMRSDQLDVVFIGTSVANPEGVVVDSLLTEAMVVALPSGHPLARRASGGETALSLKALADETFILFGRPRGAMTLQSNAVVAACQAAGFNPRIGPIVPHISARLNFVAAGLGVAVVAASLRRMNIDGVAYRRLKGAAQLKVPLVLVSRRGDPSTVVQQFRKLAKRIARSFHVTDGKAP
jgi:DNA-binding transcriptional LysR family regulator